jgi:hypothetical protein
MNEGIVKKRLSDKDVNSPHRFDSIHHHATQPKMDVAISSGMKAAPETIH